MICNFYFNTAQNQVNIINKSLKVSLNYPRLNKYYGKFLLENYFWSFNIYFKVYFHLLNKNPPEIVLSQKQTWLDIYAKIIFCLIFAWEKHFFKYLALFISQSSFKLIVRNNFFFLIFYFKQIVILKRIIIYNCGIIWVHFYQQKISSVLF